MKKVNAFKVVAIISAQGIPIDYLDVGMKGKLKNEYQKNSWVFNVNKNAPRIIVCGDGHLMSDIGRRNNVLTFTMNVKHLARINIVFRSSDSIDNFFNELDVKRNIRLEVGA